MSKLKPTKKKNINPDARVVPMAIKVSIREQLNLWKAADKYTEGNTSELLRYAVFEFIKKGMSK